MINGPQIAKQEIIDEFVTKLRNYISGQTNWVGSTGVWNTTVGNIITTGGNQAPITPDPGNNHNSVDPGGPVASDLPKEIDASDLRSLITTWMTIYSRTQRVRLVKYGTTGGDTPVEGIYRFLTTNHNVGATVNATTAALDSFDIKEGVPVNKAKLNDLMNQLQNIWITTARNVVRAQYNWNWCHSSCHSSRSRR